jgi:hypothetical protein
VEKRENKSDKKENGQIFEKNGDKTKQFISYILTSRKLMIQFGGRVMYNIYENPS